MLHVVRDNRRHDWDWPQLPEEEDDDLWERPQTLAPRRHAHRKRRSPGGRVALAVLAAVLLMGVGAATYVIASNGAVDAAVARLPWLLLAPLHQSAAVPSQASTAAVPPPAATPAPLPAATMPQPAARPSVPDVPGLVILIRSAIVALDQANATGDYSVLRAIAAPAFQQANTPASLSQSFANLRRRDVDLSRVTVVNPHLNSQATVDERGLLKLGGFFGAGSEQMNFDLSFQLVEGHWRLFGIGVHPPQTTAGDETAGQKKRTAKAAATTVPDDATLITLIRSTVIALNQANQVGDYAVLREIAAPGFRNANSLAQLASIFAALRARNLDLAPVAVIDPRLARKATIDKRGYLRLTGYFPSEPEQVNFDLAFQFSDGQWRLFGIGLNTSRGAAASTASRDQASGKAAKSAPAAPGPTPHLRPPG